MIFKCVTVSQGQLVIRINAFIFLIYILAILISASLFFIKQTPPNPTHKMQSLNDEYVAGNIPTSSEIARQYKRVRYAEILESHPDIDIAGQSDLGERLIILDSMLASQSVGNPVNPQINTIAQIVAASIQLACQPGGAIQQSLQQTIQPIQRAVERVQQNIQTLQRTIQAERALDRDIANAQYSNSKLTTRTVNVTAIPLLKDAHLELMVPQTVSEFFGMTVNQITPLLEAYNINVPQGAVRMDKLNALAHYFRLSVVQ